MMRDQSVILWRGIQMPGHEACRLFSQDSVWHIEGTAVFLYNQQACSLSYQIVCDNAWHTQNVTVGGWVGKNSIDLHIRADQDNDWWLNDAEVPAVAGCIDIDLNFSPSTNLIPVRRLKLRTGESADIIAAWLRFPTFRLQPLPQKYQRLDEYFYRYESGGGKFMADLRVNQDGFAVDYPGLWQAEPTG